ncbi:MAG: metallophosphoesterase [Candidatus Kapabacteria bacterium]|nr:metallophosphoesterase [Candidatus Kapabacteria bacterium]MDW8225141.1 metallophosphoesterase [Bacteroidota bacterium]
MQLLFALAAVIVVTNWTKLWLVQAELAPKAVRVFGTPLPRAELPRSLPEASDTTLRWMVLGDWGTGGIIQRQVAQSMVLMARRAPVHFILSTGDNIYPAGVRSADDPQWVSKFERIYADSTLRVPWYPVLGNHDYQGMPEAQVAYGKQNPLWYMPARYYSVVRYLHDSTPVLFVALDTQELLATSGAGRQRQMKWIERTLEDFPGVWKLVWGHHPLRSAGAYGENRELLRLLKPIFDRHGVVAYFCGHEHDLQLLKHPDDRFVCIVSGAGGGVRSTAYGPHSLFATAQPGFVYAALGKQSLYLWFITVGGVPQYVAEVLQPRREP